MMRRVYYKLEELFRIKVVGNTFVYVAGNLMQRAASFLLIPLYTRYLSPEDYGIWGTLVSIISVLNVLLDMGISNAVVRYYYDYFEQPARVKSYLTTNFLFRVIGGGVLIGSLYLFGTPLWEWVTGEIIPFNPYAPVVLGAVYGETLAALVTSVYRAQQRAIRFVSAKVGLAILQISSSIYFVVVLEQGALGPLHGRLVSTSIVGTILSITFLCEHWTSRLRWRDLRDSLGYGIPLIPHQLAGWMRSAADKVILVQFVPLAVLGIYNLGYSAGLVMSILILSIDLAYSPYYYRLMKTRSDARDIVVSFGSLYVGGMGTLCLIGSLFASEIIHLIAPPSYYQAIEVIPLVLMSYLLHGQYTQCVKPLFYNKKTKTIPWLTGIPALVGIGLNLVLVPTWGIWAALWVTFGTFLLTLMVVCVVSNRADPINYPFTRILALNGMVMVGVLLATYVFPVEIVPSLVLLKSLYLGIYCAVAMQSLVRPYLPRLRVALLSGQKTITSDSAA